MPEKRKFDLTNNPSQEGNESDRRVRQSSDRQLPSLNVAKHFYGVPSSLGKRKETEGTDGQSNPEDIIKGQDLMKRLQQMSIHEMEAVHERLKESDQIKRRQELNDFYGQREDEI